MFRVVNARAPRAVDVEGCLHGRKDATMEVTIHVPDAMATRWQALGPGERDPLVLAQALGAAVCRIDDLDGRREAQQRGLAVTGTLGMLERAACQGWLDLPTALTRLRATTLCASAELRATLRTRDAARQARRAAGTDHPAP
jgi:hypothetical protein